VSVQQTNRLIYEEVNSLLKNGPLKPKNKIHQVDWRKGYIKGNIIVCEDQGYHMVLHVRRRALEACGHAHWRKCRYCKMHSDPVTMASSLDRSGYPVYAHFECVAQVQRMLRKDPKNKKCANEKRRLYRQMIRKMKKLYFIS